MKEKTYEWMTIYLAEFFSFEAFNFSHKSFLVQYTCKDVFWKSTFNPVALDWILLSIIIRPVDKVSLYYDSFFIVVRLQILSMRLWNFIWYARIFNYEKFRKFYISDYAKFFHENYIRALNFSQFKDGGSI